MTTITLSNATIAASAPSGSVVGTFNASGVQVLKTGPSADYFSVSGQNLITNWTSRPPAGAYKIWVFAANSEPAAFSVTLSAVASKPTPTSVTLTPASVSVPDNSATGLLLSKIAVKMSDNSTFAGTLALPQNALVVLSGSSVVLKRALVAGDDGAHQYKVTATQNGASASATLTLTVTAVASTVSPDGTMSAAPNGAALTTADGKWTWGASASGRPGEYFVVLNGTPTVGIGSAMEVANGGRLYVSTVNSGWYIWASGGFSNSSAPGSAGPSSVTLTPANPSLPDNSPTGATVSTIAVAMSDGSAFAGTLAISTNNMVSISGTKAVLSRGLSASDDGTKSYTITATQGGNSKTATLALVVTAVAPSVAMLTASPTTVASGGTVTASWGGATNGTSTDWIAVFAAGASNNAYQSWKYTGGAATGSLSLTVPSSAGQYELRYLYMDGYTSLATSSAITVNAPARTLVLSISNPPQIPDNSPSGTLVSTATVKYSDGTQPASVTLTSSDTSFVAVQGMKLVLARSMTTADDGAHNVTITASDGLGALATASLFQVD